MILYIETNFVSGNGFGRDAFGHELLALPMSELTIALPSICLMESWSVFEEERRRRGRLNTELELQLGQLRRDLTSSAARAMVGHVEGALLANDRLKDDILLRLVDIVSRLATRAVFIPLQPEVSTTVAESLIIEQPPLMDEPTDRLVLSVILSHARQHSEEEKILLTGNSRDFDTQAVRQELAAVGIHRYFHSTEAFLGWFHSGSKDQG